MHKYRHGILNIIDRQTSDIIKKIIFKRFAIDLSFLEDYIFRKRLTYSLNFLNITPLNNNEQITIITNNQLQIILHCVFPDEAELFRDTDMWNLLKIYILSKINRENKYKILFFNATAGEDLYSTLILLNELKIKDNFEITLISPSTYSIEKIKNGIISQPKNRTSISNFKTVIPKESITKYLGYINNTLSFDNNLLNNINFINCLPFDIVSEDFDIVFSRNKALCFNNLNIESLFVEISKNIKQSGYMITGTNENIPNNIINSFKIIYNNEKIFQKK